MFAAAVSKPEIAQNAFVATKKCKSMPPQQSSSTEHSKKEIQAATFLAEGALSLISIWLWNFKDGGS